MTGMRIRQCPRCGLRFTSSSELEDHLAQDHRPRQTTAVSHTTARVASPAQTRPLHDPDGRPRVHRRAGLLAWPLFAAWLVIVALAAWLASSPAALVAATLVVVASTAAYGWRTWARAEQRRARRPR
jgi:Flp pilus assembly protein TadB